MDEHTTSQHFEEARHQAEALTNFLQRLVSAEHILATARDAASALERLAADGQRLNLEIQSLQDQRSDLLQALDALPKRFEEQRAEVRRRLEAELTHERKATEERIAALEAEVAQAETAAAIRQQQLEQQQQAAMARYDAAVAIRQERINDLKNEEIALQAQVKSLEQHVSEVRAELMKLLEQKV